MSLFLASLTIVDEQFKGKIKREGGETVRSGVKPSLGR